MAFTRRGIVLATVIWALFTAAAACGQAYNPFNQRDDTYTLLGLKRAQQTYETARMELERQEALYERRLISDVELQRARNAFTDAEVNFQQSLLAVLFEEQYITVSKAVKYQAGDGTKHVRLTLANTSTGSAEFQKLVHIEDELFRSLQPDVIPNVYVSILNEDNAIISRPYEAKIPELRNAEPITLDFALLQDLDAVTVFMIYGNGHQRTMKIFLQKDESVDRVLVQSQQFSQEVELGQSTSFDLSLELFSGTSNTFALEVVNLPEQVGRFFKDAGGQVRLKQVKFTESSRSMRAALEVALPDRPGGDVVIDRPLRFFVLAVPPDRSLNLAELRARTWTEPQLRELNVGFVALELVPRGKGELRVRIPQMYHAVDRDERVHLLVEMVNEGSHRLDNIELAFDLPFAWSYEVVPEQIGSLDIAREARAEVILSPPDDIAPGKYSVRIRISAVSNGEPLTAEDKTVTVEVRPDTDLVSTVLIVTVLLGLVAGVVVFGIKLTRR